MHPFPLYIAYTIAHYCLAFRFRRIIIFFVGDSCCAAIEASETNLVSFYPPIRATPFLISTREWLRFQLLSQHAARDSGKR